MFKKIIVLITLIVLSLGISFAEEPTIESIFIESITEEGEAYISYGIEVSEHQDGTYTLSVLTKENILGVDLGFFASPSILKNFESTEIKPQTYIEGAYFYIISEKKYDKFDELSKDLQFVTGYRLAKDGDKLLGEVDLSIWNEERKEDEVLNLVYSTNRYLFSYKPLKKISGNYSDVNEAYYIWNFENDSENYIYAEPVSNIGTIATIVIIGILFFSLITFIIIRKSS